MSRASLPKFDRAHVLVAGDVMIDRYWIGEVSRISPEAPVPVVEVGKHEDRPGGAANVACNLAGLGAAVTLVGLVGRDAAADALRCMLARLGVYCSFAETGTEPTILKLRVLARNQQLIRLDMERAFSGSEAAEVARLAAQAMERADALVLSDYGKNTLSDIPGLIAQAKGRPVLADPKGTDFSRYRGVFLLKPNLAEFEAVAGRCNSLDEIVARGRDMVRTLDLRHLLITCGQKGMVLISANGTAERFPARAREVYDVTGAGDTVIAVLAAAIAAGEEVAPAVALANLAAGIVVGKVGTARVNREELARASGEAQRADSLSALLDDVARARKNGERIVFTNGCFDILHAGHVHYLQQARALGDRLIVAVNSDESVRRLKGGGRPCNTLDKRMKVLAALRPVDWVVPFSEDTPERLLRIIRPDVLVKGGDYSIDRIKGADFVRSYGGEVRVVDYLPGNSTTALLEELARPA